MKEWSSRCISEAAQVSPLSIHITLSFGKRTGRPLMTQLVMWIMLNHMKPSACTEMKRLVICSARSSQL